MSPLQIYENWWSLAPNRPGLPYVSQEYVFNIGKQILPTLCLEAAPRTAQIPHKVISSCQPGDFPGPVSWSELLWAKFASLAHRQLIHPLFFFFFISYSPWFPAASSNVCKSRQILLQLTVKESYTRSVYSSTKKYVRRRHTQKRVGPLGILVSCPK